jgi:toxin-antitoxin system PIN domain toxin
LIPYLLDVNILLNLAWIDLKNHSKATRWFLAAGKNSFATCPMTQAGFVRISSSPRVLPKPATIREAMEILRQLTQEKGHVFWPLETPLRESTAFCVDRLFGPGQLTDAYLLGLAIARGGTLVTLDRGILHLAGPTYAKHVLVLS